MINREIVYDRTMAGSYMKIPVGLNYAKIDEKLILRRKLSGALAVEKTYVDGVGQYWYNISGKQSLDTYCRVKEIGAAFVERLIVSICSELEILEWNLIRPDCLMLDPELIFIANSNQEIIFTLYPENNSSLELEFQRLMEYLLKKINHKDVQGMREVYAIYERTLEEGYSLFDIRKEFVEEKGQMQESDYGSEHSPMPPIEPWKDSRRGETESKAPAVKRVENVRENKESLSEEESLVQKPPREKFSNKKSKRKTTKEESLKDKLLKYICRELGISYQRKDKSKRMERPVYVEREKKEDSKLVYPEEELYVPEEQIHPTICLSSYSGAPRGILMYQGAEQMPDLHLGGKSNRIGHCSEAEIQIDRDTISQMHAKIDREGTGYYIEDLNSTNGTYVNDELLNYKERRLLKTNDIICFADIRYRFC